jgi:peptide/nickel transport system permease protein
MYIERNAETDLQKEGAMRGYIIRRLMFIIPTLLAVTIAVFLTVRFIPGNVIDLMVAEMSTQGTIMDHDVLVAQLRHNLGLDVPIYVQYFRWLGIARQDDGGFHGIFQGDLGHSLWG